MPSEKEWEELAPHVRRRICPACGEQLERFHLTALLLPIEQFTIPAIQEVNNAIEWSIRPFGAQNLHELQLMVFTSPCTHCTFVSTWDFSTIELNEILGPYGQPPYAQIAWNYEPGMIADKVAAAPEWLKPQLQALLDVIKPRS